MGARRARGSNKFSSVQFRGRGGLPWCSNHAQKLTPQHFLTLSVCYNTAYGATRYRTSPVLTARGAYSVYWGLLGVLVGQVAGFRAGGEIDVVEGGLVRRSCRPWTVPTRNGSRSRSRTRRRVESVRSTDGPPLLVPSRKDSMSIHNLRAVTKLEAQLTDAGASAHRPCVPPLQARPPRWQPPRPPLAARPPLLAPHAVEGGSQRHS